MQMAYTMTSENTYEAAWWRWWRLLQKAMHHTPEPRNENTIHTYLLSHVNTLFIWNENRSKHILSHILSRSLIYCTLFPFEIWNMNSEIVNEMESSSYVLFRTRRCKKHYQRVDKRMREIFLFKLKVFLFIRFTLSSLLPRGGSEASCGRRI